MAFAIKKFKYHLLTSSVERLAYCLAYKVINLGGGGDGERVTWSICSNLQDLSSCLSYSIMHACVGRFLCVATAATAAAAVERSESAVQRHILRWHTGILEAWTGVHVIGFGVNIGGGCLKVWGGQQKHHKYLLCSCHVCLRLIG